MASFGQRVVGVMSADVKTLQEIEADPAAIGQAVTVIVLAGVAALVGDIFRAGISAGVIALVLSLVSYALWSLLIVLIGTKLMPEPTTKADFNEAFRVIGFTAAPGLFNVLAIIPVLGVVVSFVIWLWTLVIGVIAVREVLDYSNTGRAIIVCLIALATMWLITLLVVTPLLVGGAIAGSLG